MYVWRIVEIGVWKALVLWEASSQWYNANNSGWNSSWGDLIHKSKDCSWCTTLYWCGLMKKTRNYPKSHKVAQDCIDCRVKGKNVEATSAQKTCDTCKWHLDPFSGARKNLNIGRKARKYQTQKLIIARAAAVSTLTENETYELPWGSSSFSEAGRFQHNQPHPPEKQPQQGPARLHGWMDPGDTAMGEGKNYNLKMFNRFVSLTNIDVMYSSKPVATHLTSWRRGWTWHDYMLKIKKVACPMHILHRWKSSEYHQAFGKRSRPWIRLQTPKSISVFSCLFFSIEPGWSPGSQRPRAQLQEAPQTFAIPNIFGSSPGAFVDQSFQLSQMDIWHTWFEHWVASETATSALQSTWWIPVLNHPIPSIILNIS